MRVFVEGVGLWGLYDLGDDRYSVWGQGYVIFNGTKTRHYPSIPNPSLKSVSDLARSCF